MIEESWKGKGDAAISFTWMLQRKTGNKIYIRIFNSTCTIFIVQCPLLEELGFIMLSIYVSMQSVLEVGKGFSFSMPPIIWSNARLDSFCCSTTVHWAVSQMHVSINLFKLFINVYIINLFKLVINIYIINLFMLFIHFATIVVAKCQGSWG